MEIAHNFEIVITMILLSFQFSSSLLNLMFTHILQHNLLLGTVLLVKLCSQTYSRSAIIYYVMLVFLKSKLQNVVKYRQTMSIPQKHRTTRNGIKIYSNVVNCHWMVCRSEMTTMRTDFHMKYTTMYVRRRGLFWEIFTSSRNGIKMQ